MQPHIFDKINYSLIKTFVCPKLSEHARGKIHYQIWRNNDDHSLGLAISKNESSGGFSAELVMIDEIVKQLKTLRKTGKPFHATALKPLFIGRSVNTPCFLAAALVHQQVIQPHPQIQRLLEIHDQMDQWPTMLVTMQPEPDAITAKDHTLEKQLIDRTPPNAKKAKDLSTSKANQKTELAEASHVYHSTQKSSRPDQGSGYQTGDSAAD
ncbi:hypothetical protein [Alkanindiges hydrocarboniclasticus]|uniref:hypothetical protein n=1 Tax=Alkanindiges hydrocarboniclasticus TaxID=1907941 RepID=UPI001177B6FB|nr:hypothetical protein [Alkanindiges hydrocarboniclasticus]